MTACYTCMFEQDGRRVVGFGPRSPLSEIVKSSVDRYIYTCNTGLEDDLQVRELGGT